MKDIFLIVVPTRFDSTSPTIERHLQKQQQLHLLSCLPLCKSVSNARASSQDAKSQSGSPCITLSTAASLNLLAVVREPSGTPSHRPTLPLRIVGQVAVAALCCAVDQLPGIGTVASTVPSASPEDPVRAPSWTASGLPSRRPGPASVHRLRSRKPCGPSPAPRDRSGLCRPFI